MEHVEITNNYNGMRYEGPWGLPEDYKKALIELLTFQADSEFMGGMRVAENLRFAPRPEEALRLSKKVKEEYGHGVYLWNILKPLGVDVDARLKAIVQNPFEDAPGGTKIINAFKYKNWKHLFDCWEDVAIFSTVVTPGAVAFLGQYQHSSYLPWAKVSERIFTEELGHLGFGMWASNRVIEFDGEKGRERLQNAIPKFLSVGLGFYGRDAKESEHFKMYHRFGLKPKFPEQLREEYMNIVESRLKELGLEVPKGVEANYDMNF